MPLPNEVAFLFGAGISIPAGIPGTDRITSQVLSGERVIRHTDGTFYLADLESPGVGVTDNHVLRAVLLLRRLRIAIDTYYLYDLHHHTNYEELYYVCSQIHDSELKEYDNPAVQPFIEKVLPDIERLLKSQEDDHTEEWDLIRLVSEAMNYVRDVVWHLLLKKPERTDHLLCIRDACLDQDLDRVDIFTLNHDTVLELALSQNKIPVNISFGAPVEDVRYWDPMLIEEAEDKVRLFKLHGSINWFRFPPNELTNGIEAIGIPIEWDIWHTKGPTGELQYPVGGRPEFLAGTFNKMLQYTSGLYADLYCQFRRSLREKKWLVICGYGFGDKGINSQIIEWMYLSPEKSMTIIHPDPGKLRSRARGAIQKNWEEWSKQDRISSVLKYIESTTWQDIKGSFPTYNLNGS